MATLGPTAIKVYAASAGFPAKELPTAAAVALAESSGRTDVVNGSGNVGLWQIGPKGSANDAGVGKSAAQLKDPLTNAQAAYRIWKRAGGSWAHDWTAYRSGAYKQYLGQATIAPGPNEQDITDTIGHTIEGAAGDVADATGITAVADTAGQVGKLATILSKGGAWVSKPSNWLRVAYVGGGALMVVSGLNMMVQNKALGSVAGALGGDKGGGTVKSATTIGKAIVGKGKAGKAKTAGGAT